jgi:hypothetical protein
MRRNTEDDLWKKVIKQESGCWEWQGHTLQGYGYFRSKFIDEILTHRVVWTLKNGAIPTGSHHGTTCVCHICDNKLCCNPDHLFLGTQADNVFDMVSKFRHRGAKGTDNGSAKLSVEQVKEIRDLLCHSPRLTKVQIAKNYEVTPTLIRSIELGKIWGSLPWA